MADSKVSNLTELVAPARGDQLYVVSDPSGVPASRFARIESVVAGPELFVAADDASATEKRNANYLCDGADDDVQIIAALAALPVGGGTVKLSRGTFTLGNATINLAERQRLLGQGIGTEVSSANGNTAGMFTMEIQSQLSDLRVTAPTTLTDHIISMDGVDARPGWGGGGVVLSNLYIEGGAAADTYAISILDTFGFYLENIQMGVGCNGVRLGADDTPYNVGNSAINMVEITLTSANRVGWDIHGITGIKNYNLMSFTYISTITGVGVGSYGIKIRNCGYMTFINADIEGPENALYIEGGINGGQAAVSNVFVNPYFGTVLGVGGNVTIASGAYTTIFVGGRIYGTITDSVTIAGRTTRYYGTAGVGGINIDDKTTIWKSGPTGGSQGLTVTLRNQTGAELPLGTMVKIAAINFGVQITTGGSAWAGVALATSAPATYTDFGVSGIFDCLSSTDATRGDYMVLDPANNGKVKSIGVVAPDPAAAYVGQAVETTGGAGLVAVLLNGFRPA